MGRKYTAGSRTRVRTAVGPLFEMLHIYGKLRGSLAPSRRERLAALLCKLRRDAPLNFSSPRVSERAEPVAAPGAIAVIHSTRTPTLIPRSATESVMCVRTSLKTCSQLSTEAV